MNKTKFLRPTPRPEQQDQDKDQDQSLQDQDQDQDQFLLVWDRSCHKTEVSDHITEQNHTASV